MSAEPARARARDAIAVAIVASAFAVGAVAFVLGDVESGIRLALGDDGRVYVVDVDPWSPQSGSELPGMVVTTLNDQALIVMPGDEGTPVAGQALSFLLADRIYMLQAIRPEELDHNLGAPAEERYGTTFVYTGWWALDESGMAPLLGIAILIVGGWWLGSGRGGQTLKELAVPTIVATATPLFLVPAVLTATAAGLVIVAILWPVSALPLADGLSGLVADRVARRNVRAAALLAAVCSAVAGLATLVFGLDPWFIVGQWLAAGAVALIPGYVAARPAMATSGASASRRVVETMELVAVGATPLIAGVVLIARDSAPFLSPLLLWFLILLVAQRYTIRPLARLATRATLQRDLVVAATEAERARIAADLHDETLQDLTLLVRQLEARGDVDGAEAGRRIAERVRTLTGELRLPILDDLGVGPALEWLVSRIEALAGGQVILERDEGSRLPSDIELAFFRVAQEALSNAVKHGKPPILVRYRSAVSGATLTIDDAGPGIPAEAAEVAPAAGHFGLLGMQQRAEQIGALLDVRQWPAGGTHVALEWRAR